MGYYDARIIDLIVIPVSLYIVSDFLTLSDDIAVINDGSPYLCPFFNDRMSEDYRLFHLSPAGNVHISSNDGIPDVAAGNNGSPYHERVFNKPSLTFGIYHHFGRGVMMLY
jgi:hypothetical protein